MCINRNKWLLLRLSLLFLPLLHIDPLWSPFACIVVPSLALVWKYTWLSKISYTMFPILNWYGLWGYTIETFLAEFFELFFWGTIIKKVSTLCLANTSSLSPPLPSSTSNLFPSSFKVAFVMWTRLQQKQNSMFLPFWSL